MWRGNVGVWMALLVAGGSASAVTSGCDEDEAQASAEASEVDDAPAEPATFDGTEDEPATDEEERARERRLDEHYPLHGVVTGVQLAVRDAPDPEAAVLGWLRIGSRLRMGDALETTETCNSGWRPVHPRGWACTGQGIALGEEPPDVELVVEPPSRDDPLPYAYHFIKENMVPEYHRLPSRDEQRAAQAYADRYFELHEQNERRAERFLAGELPGEPRKPAVVHRYLDRGFYVAGTGVEVRAFRRFVRTVRGSYVKEARTKQRTGSEHEGVTLDDERSLPVAFARRAIRPLIRREREDEPDRFVRDEDMEAIPRMDVVTSWVRRERVGDHIYHRLEMDGETRYARDWFIGVAQPQEPPSQVDDHAPWVHVDLSEQTLVLYEGARPVFATLVSTGVDEHPTPTGTFTIRRKLLSDTMANLGPDAGDDRYRIEDVPWTQYFSGSIALHGAFWHDRFGLERSHGCINLSPRDAHRVFLRTWPRVPSGWHGITTDGDGMTASLVVVTD